METELKGRDSGHGLRGHAAGLWLLAVWLWLGCAETAAQEDLLLWQEDLELLAGEDGGSDGWADELEALADLRRAPLDINAATRAELERFPFLDARQVEEIQAYVYLHGPMKSIHELRLVPGLDRRTCELLAPFVRVDPGEGGGAPRVPTLRQLLSRSRHEVRARLDVPLYRRAGYATDYLGPPLRHSLRYRFSATSRLRFGFSGENDAGEPFFALHNRRGYDSYSGYFFVRDLGRLEALAAGNYRAGYGYGLVMGSGFLAGKSFSLSTARRRQGGLRPHTSTGEYDYLRGAALKVRAARWLALTAFYSHRRLDATLEADGSASAIQETGLHRTAREADRRRALTMQLAGGRADVRLGRVEAGLTGICYGFDRDYLPRQREYSRYYLRGRRFFNAGADYRLRFGPLTLEGEAATGTRGYALYNVVSARLPWWGLNALLSHRLYTHDYWAFFARAFGEGGGPPRNENGWYAALEAAPAEGWRLMASADFFASPWWRYRVSKPSRGTDLRWQAAWTRDRGLTVLGSYRLRLKERDLAGTGGAVVLPTRHHVVRLRLVASPGAGWTLRTTADGNRFRHGGLPPSQGWQLVQACAYRPWEGALRVVVQAAYFDTDGYDSRVYAYEEGLPGTFYVPSFSGRGLRWSACLSCEWRGRLSLVAKWGQTVYLDRTSIGTGTELIEGNRKSDVQLQLTLAL